MNSTTQYQPVHATTRIKCRCRPSSESIFIMLVLCTGFGIALTAFGVIGYHKLNSFSTEPSSCRVNSVGTVKYKTLIWNVDIVKQSQSKETITGYDVLRSNLKIRGDGDEIRYSSVALEYTTRGHSIGKIYPCYHRKDLLDNAAYNDSQKISSEDLVQWEKPTQQRSILLLFVGSAFIIVGMIPLMIRVLNFLTDNN